MNPTTNSLVWALTAGLLFLPATHGGVVISNLGETPHLDATVDNNFAVSQSFFAGSTVTLDTVTLRLTLNPISAGLAINLHANNAGSPAASSLAGLTFQSGPGNGGAGLYVYTAPANLTLTSGSTYWVVATAAASLTAWNATSSVNQTGTSGWSIGDDHKVRGFGGAWGLTSDTMFLSLDATPVPEPEAVAWACGTGLLGFAGWRRWQRARGARR